MRGAKVQPFFDFANPFSKNARKINNYHQFLLFKEVNFTLFYLMIVVGKGCNER